MNRLRWALMAVAVLWGLLLPELYDWSGEDQSRPAAVLRWLALGIFVFDVVAIGWLVWQHFKKPPAQSEYTQRTRFGIRHVLVATTVVAMVVAAERMIKLPLANGIVVAVVFGSVWIAIKRPATRWEIGALLTCMWAPFLWVLRWPEFRGHIFEVLMVMPGAPALLPGVWTSQLIGWNKIGATLPGLFSLVEVLIGLWLMRLGARPALAYLLVVLTASLINSFAFQALVRM